jgi:hypothetical protein
MFRFFLEDEILDKYPYNHKPPFDESFFTSLQKYSIEKKDLLEKIE